MSLYAHSLASTDSYPNSHHRTRNGSFSSSMRCPLLDSFESRRPSDAGSILPMRPLPTIIKPQFCESSSHIYSYYNPSTSSSLPSARPSLNATLKTTIHSSTISNTTFPGTNVFLPLRRRFLPNLDGRLSLTKPRVETQLLGELLLALEEYVAAFGRQVKVSGSHCFGPNGTSAAVVVVVAAASVHVPHSASTLLESTLEETEGSIQDSDWCDEPSSPTQHSSTSSIIHNSSDGQSDGLATSSTSLPVNRLSSSKISRRQLAELCDELEYVTNEVVDVVPAFGEKLMQGHYGPLAVRASSPRMLPSSSQSGISLSGPSSSAYRLSASGTTPGNVTPSAIYPSTSALDRFADFEPGAPKDTSHGGSAWWAQRLLRDLLDGLVSETVNSTVTTTLLHSVASHAPKNPHSNHALPSSTASQPICQTASLPNTRPRHLAEQAKDLFDQEDRQPDNPVEPLTPGRGPHRALHQPGTRVHQAVSPVFSEDPVSETGPSIPVQLTSDGPLHNDHQRELLDQGRRRWLAYQAHKEGSATRSDPQAYLYHQPLQSQRMAFQPRRLI